MDSKNDEPSMSVADRISNVSDDIIHRVLSFLDMKIVVQTCVLSHRWKHIWMSTPHLNLNSRTFGDLSQFAYFVEQLLARRNNCAEVSAVDITYSRSASDPVVISIVNYAYSHKARQLTVTSFDHIGYTFPQDLFSSLTLKYLTINQIQQRNHIRSLLPNSTWFFPALETLHLENIRFDVHGDYNFNLFSKCLNLKDLTLHKCCMYGLESFSIYAPQLRNLKVTEPTSFPKVLNVVAPQLKNLTASVSTLHSNQMQCFNYLRLSTEGFGSLEKVNLFTSNGNYNKRERASIILDLFRMVRNAKLLILDVDIIMCLSSHLSQHVQEPCPFDNLKCLKISNCFTHFENYLLENSPNVTFITDLSQRSRQDAPDDIMPIKVAKLEETLQIRDLLIANQQTELQMKHQVIANQNMNIQMNDQVIANLKADIQMKDQVIANQNENMQLKDQVIAELKEMIQRLKSNNISTQSDVPAPPPMP